MEKLSSSCQKEEGITLFTGFARTIILYAIIIVGIRLMGKRQVGELEPSELVLSLLIADLASVPMQDVELPLHTGVVPMLTLLAITMAMSVLTVKSIRFRTLLCGQPSIVIKKGAIDQREMSKTRLTIDELLEELRGQGYTDLSTVEYAILETNGMLSVLPYQNQKPPSALDLGVAVSGGGLPAILISDGNLIQKNLALGGHSLDWLNEKMREFGVSNMRDIFLLTVDEAGAVYCIAKELPHRGGAA